MNNRNRHNQPRKKLYHFALERDEKFMYSDDSENTFRVDITDKSNTEKLGKLIGNLIVETYNENNPLKAIYLTGVAKTGKTTLTENIMKSFSAPDDFTIDRKPKYQIYDNVYPKVHHIDYFAKRHLAKGINKESLNEDEFLIAEWPDALNPEQLEENRLEIECEIILENETITGKKLDFITRYIHFDKEERSHTRYATIIGYGNGIELLKKVKEQYNA